MRGDTGCPFPFMKKSTSPPTAPAALAEKDQLHPRNPHRAPYDFPLLSKVSPALAAFVRPNPYGSLSIDFADPAAVKALNRALLKHFYDVEHWDIPKGYLCPPIPGRADYVHYLADLLAESNGGVLPPGEEITVLDVGVGANCIYPIIGRRAYGWHFVGSDVDGVAVRAAQQIEAANPLLAGAIEARLQPARTRIFDGLIQSGEFPGTRGDGDPPEESEGRTDGGLVLRRPRPDKHFGDRDAARHGLFVVDDGL